MLSLKSGTAIAVAAAALFAMGATVSTIAQADDATVKCAGANSCKGTSECKGATNDCKGQNSCKGKGGCKMDQAGIDAAAKKVGMAADKAGKAHGCKGLNECKGLGGCKAS